MKNRNMRDLEKRWAEDRKKAAAKAAKANPKQNHKPSGQGNSPEAKDTNTPK